MAGDRHREKPLSLRLGPQRQRLEDYASATRQPVRRVIADAVRAWLDQHATATGESGAELTRLSIRGRAQEPPGPAHGPGGSEGPEGDWALSR